MSKLLKLCLIVATGSVLTAVTIYSALPSRIMPVSLVATTDTETAVKIVGDDGGSVTRTFVLPQAPRDTPRLGIALRPATYLLNPSATITVVIGSSDRCTFGPHQYTDGGTVTCPVTGSRARRLRISVRGAQGPLALIERQTTAGDNVAAIWVQIPRSSLEGRMRFVLTALSTTRPWLFSWPLAIFGFAVSVLGSLWLGLSVVSRAGGLDIEAASPKVDSETTA
jgi:hypothetical protein